MREVELTTASGLSPGGGREGRGGPGLRRGPGGGGRRQGQGREGGGLGDVLAVLRHRLPARGGGPRLRPRGRDPRRPLLRGGEAAGAGTGVAEAPPGPPPVVVFQK